MNEKLSAFLNFGIPNNLAEKLDLASITIQQAKRLSKTELVKDFNLSKTEADILKKFITRKPVSSDVLYKLLENNNFTCCVCKGIKSDSFIVHHIKEYSKSKDNSYKNLAVLCLNDHDLAHKVGITITYKLTASDILKAKFAWEKFVVEYSKKAARRPKSAQQWILLASKIANYFNDHVFQVHRGAILFDIDVTAVFGNDGFENDAKLKHAKSEVKKLRQHLKKNHLTEIGFGLSDDKYSWCLLVKSNKVNYLNKILWSFYPLGGSNNSVQIDVANVSLHSYLTNEKNLEAYQNNLLSRYLLY